MSITPLPTPPTRSDPTNFAARADAFVAALPQFVAETNALAASMGIPATGVIYVGDTTNANMTAGLTLNQGAADNEIIALKSSDVAHGVTDVTETDTYGVLRKASPTEGGLSVRGVSEGAGGIWLDGIHTTDDTTKSTSSLGAFVARGFLKSGVTAGALGADGNLAVFISGTGTQVIFDADGETHMNTGSSWANFDAYDDVALLDDLSYAVSRDDDPIKREFVGFLKYNREALQRAKLVTFNPDGQHFVNMSKLTMALVGVARQLGGRVARLEAKFPEEPICLPSS